MLARVCHQIIQIIGNKQNQPIIIDNVNFVVNVMSTLDCIWLATQIHVRLEREREMSERDIRA